MYKKTPCAFLSNTQGEYIRCTTCFYAVSAPCFRADAANTVFPTRFIRFIKKFPKEKTLKKTAPKRNGDFRFLAYLSAYGNAL